jgi:hypothetical protein
MSARLKLTGLLMTGVLCLPIAGRAETQQADTPKADTPKADASKADTPKPHPVHKVKKQQPAPLPPPLPSGPQGPVPQISLEAIPAVAPQVSYENGMLTISAPNSTLGDILRAVRKNTAADIDVPANANERVVTRLGPGPAREVIAELLNGSRFNYILLGSPEDPSGLVRVVLVAKSGPETPAPEPGAGDKNAASAKPANPAAQAADTDAADDTMVDDTPEPAPAPAEAEQPATAPAPGQPGVKTPQQLLQEMQQRQLQQQQQSGPGGYPPANPGASVPQTPPQPPPQPPDQQ